MKGELKIDFDFPNGTKRNGMVIVKKSNGNIVNVFQHEEAWAVYLQLLGKTH